MFPLANPNTIQLLRALSMGGPATAHELAERLQVPYVVVRTELRQGVAAGVIRLLPGELGRYAVVPAAIEAAVAEQREALLGATG